MVRFGKILKTKFPEWDEEILNLFSKTRFFIRIKNLIKEMAVEATSHQARSKKQLGNHL